MSFQFLSIALKNWLVYEGEVRLDFGFPRDGHNIIVVYGMNGFGKTSLLRGIQWVFHDKMPGRHIKECFNVNALAHGENELSVTVEFLYNGLSYRLTRRAIAKTDEQYRVSGYPRMEVELAENNQLKKGSIEDAIAQILPAECQQFFFFDGLEIEKYADQMNYKDTRDAIERVLGIPEVRNLQFDLAKLEGELSKERDKLLKGKAEYKKLRDQKAEIELEIESGEQTLNELEEKRGNLLQIIERLELRSAELSAVADKQKRLSDLRRSQAEIKDRLGVYSKTLQRLVKVVTHRMVLDLLQQRQVSLNTEINKAERTTNRLSSAKTRVTVIQEILGELQCVCGSEVDDTMQAYLQNQLVELEDQVKEAQRLQDITGSLRGTIEERGHLQALIRTIDNEETQPEIQKFLLTKYKLEVEREEIEQELAVLEQELQEHEDTDVRTVYRTLAERRQELGVLDESIKRTTIDIDEAKRRREKLEQQLNLEAMNLQDEDRLGLTLNQAQTAYKVAEELVRELVKARRASIEQQLTNVFRLITNKKQEYDRIEISEDYSPHVVSNSNRIIDSSQLSAGEKEVLAFSFIAGLNLSIESGAPLVMDTPFGHLDIKHREGLIQALPKMPCQVILLATDRDIPPEDLPSMKSFLGGCYNIERDQSNARSYIYKD